MSWKGIENPFLKSIFVFHGGTAPFFASNSQNHPCFTDLLEISQRPYFSWAKRFPQIYKKKMLTQREGRASTSTCYHVDMLGGLGWRVPRQQERKRGLSVKAERPLPPRDDVLLDPPPPGWPPRPPLGWPPANLGSCTSVDEAHCCDTSGSLRLSIGQHSKAASRARVQPSTCKWLLYRTDVSM